MTDSEAKSSRRNPDRFVHETSLAVAFVLLFIFSAGMLAAVANRWTLHGAETKALVILTLFLPVAVISLVQAVRRLRGVARTSFENVGPKTGRARLVWIFSITFGLLLGMLAAMLSFADRGPAKASFDLFSGGPLPMSVAVLLLAGLAVSVVVNVFSIRNLDEHELAAQEKASFVGFSVYLVSSAAWFLAARGGLLPAMENGVIFGLSVAAFMATWLWRRYR